MAEQDSDWERNTVKKEGGVESEAAPALSEAAIVKSGKGNDDDGLSFSACQSYASSTDSTSQRPCANNSSRTYQSTSMTTIAHNKGRQEWQNTWTNFKTALYDPHHHFEAFYWVVALSSAGVKHILHLTRSYKALTRCTTAWMTLIPGLAIGIILFVLIGYFAVLEEFVVTQRWCPSSIYGKEDDHGEHEHHSNRCVWKRVHGGIVIYLGTMILWNYIWTTFASPGVALPPSSASSIIENDDKGEGKQLQFLDERTLKTTKNEHNVRSKQTIKQERWKTVDARGGCCFLNPIFNKPAEQQRVAPYGNKNYEFDNCAFYVPSPNPSYCDKCKMNRPPRCHHCSVCKRCVLQMDHHCPWVNNCIGYNNYRTFFLAVFYLVVGCWYGVALLLWSFWDIMKDQVQEHGFKFMYKNKTGILDLPLPWVLCRQFVEQRMDPNDVLKMVFPLLLGVGVTLSVFLVGHVDHVVNNVTTLEHTATLGIRKKHAFQELQNPGSMDPKLKLIINPFDQGAIGNIRQVFGTNLWLALLPVPVTLPLPYLPWSKEMKKMM